MIHIMARLRLYYPVKKPMYVNQAFGENKEPVYKQLGLIGHNGIDFYAAHGWPIYAAHNGTVTFTGLDGSGGYTIVIRTNEQYAYGDSQAFYKTVYVHLLPGTFKVTAGQQVKAGDIIAQADNTGLSTGDHLHFGLKPVYKGEQDWEWWNAEQDNGYKGAIDPAPYWTGIHAVDVPEQEARLRRLISYFTTVLTNLIKKTS